MGLSIRREFVVRLGTNAPTSVLLADTLPGPRPASSVTNTATNPVVIRRFTDVPHPPFVSKTDLRAGNAVTGQDWNRLRVTGLLLGQHRRIVLG
jgi:hypothetical protein